MERSAELLASRKTEDRLRGIQMLARNATAEHQALLLKALSDRSNYVAALAAETLGNVADESALKVMLERFLYLSEDGLRRDPGCHIRAHLAFAFGRLEYRWATDALRTGI